MQMYYSGRIEKRSFALYFSYTGLDHYEVSLPSSIIFGGSDLYTYSLGGSFVYIPLVTDADGWVVELGEVWINGQLQSVSASQARFSTGTILMFIPDSAYSNFVTALNNNTSCGSFPNHMISCPCSAGAKYPSIFLELGGVMFQIFPEAYVYQVKSN